MKTIIGRLNVYLHDPKFGNVQWIIQNFNFVIWISCNFVISFHSQVQEKVQVAKERALQLSNLNDGSDWDHHTNSFCIGTIQSLILYYYVAFIH